MSVNEGEQIWKHDVVEVEEDLTQNFVKVTEGWYRRLQVQNAPLELQHAVWEVHTLLKQAVDRLGTLEPWFPPDTGTRE
jgi:hypothetical protein